MMESPLSPNAIEVPPSLILIHIFIKDGYSSRIRFLIEFSLIAMFAISYNISFVSCAFLCHLDFRGSGHGPLSLLVPYYLPINGKEVPPLYCVPSSKMGIWFFVQLLNIPEAYCNCNGAVIKAACPFTYLYPSKMYILLYFDSDYSQLATFSVWYVFFYSCTCKYYQEIDSL